MTEVVLVRTISAPPERVFAVISDFARAAERIRGIDRVEMLTPGPVGIGTRFRETRTMFGRPASEEMTVASFDPPRGYQLLAESHGSRYETEFDLSPVEGGTQLRMRFRALPQTLLAKILARLLRGMTKKIAALCAADLDDVKAAIEAGRV
jgi:carbon monoxide dehydrogenase subunit G